MKRVGICIESNIKSTVGLNNLEGIRYCYISVLIQREEKIMNEFSDGRQLQHVVFLLDPKSLQ